MSKLNSEETIKSKKMIIKTIIQYKKRQKLRKLLQTANFLTKKPQIHLHLAKNQLHNDRKKTFQNTQDLLKVQ